MNQNDKSMKNPRNHLKLHESHSQLTVTNNTHEKSCHCLKAPDKSPYITKCRPILENTFTPVQHCIDDQLSYLDWYMETHSYARGLLACMLF